MFGAENRSLSGTDRWNQAGEMRDSEVPQPMCFTVL